MKNSLNIGGLYRHYKNKAYRVHGTAIHSETQEEVVIYEALYSNPSGQMWVRPLKMFLEKVIVDGKEMPRFAPVDSMENF